MVLIHGRSITRARIGLTMLTAAALLVVSAFVRPPGEGSGLVSWAWITVGALGAMLYGTAGVPTGTHAHAGVLQSGLTARGVGGWLLGAALTAAYTALYWWPQLLDGWVRLCDPLSQSLRGAPADQWFLYGTLYTAAVVTMGARFISRWGGQRYHLLRTLTLMASQFVLAWWLPGFLRRAQQPELYLSYFWPLDYDALFPSTARSLLDVPNALGGFALGWSVLLTFVATPLLTYHFGKRWYCSWVCGCGGLAETAGDPFRHLSDKSARAWTIERWSIHGVLVLVTVMTSLVALAEWGWAGPFNDFAWRIKSFYGFFIGALFSGVVGVGFYPLLGSRVWCRFGCPMAAGMGLIQRFWSRFRITTNGGQCISCGNCSTHCEMGIDVRAYAQKGENIVRASCVGCGVCASVCPRGVLKLELGDPRDRFAGADQPLVQIRRSLRSGRA